MILFKLQITEEKAVELPSTFFSVDHTYHLGFLMEGKEGAEGFSLHSFQNTHIKIQCSEYLSLTTLYIMNPLNVNV